MVVRTTPKGLDFIRRGIAMAVTENNPAEAAGYAEARWGGASRATRITKAAVAGITTGGPAGDALASDEGAAAEFFELVRARSILGRLAVRRVGFDVPTLSMDEGARVQWRGEGKGINATPLKLTRQSRLPRLSVAALVVATNEQLEARGDDAEIVIRDDLAKALAAAVDSAFIDPANSGSANVKPASVTNGADQNSPSEGLFEWFDTFTGDPENAVIIMHPFTAARLYGAARPDIGARGGSWAGWPVITSSAVDPETFVFLDPGQIAVAIDNADIRASRQASVDMADNTSQSSSATVAATNITSMWQSNSTAIIGCVDANWRVIRPEAVQYFSTQSFGL